MCGIGGIIRCKSRPIQEAQVTSLLLGLESRGYEASGVAIVNDGDPTPQVYKNDDTATIFVGSKGYSEFIKKFLSPKTKTILAHTRLSTGQADPRDNANNHPLFDGVSAVVHNGCISNDDILFTQKSLERKAKTDSDILRAIADQDGLTRKGVRELAKVCGSVAAAIINKNYPGHVLLLRSGNPLVIGNSSDFIIWASTKKAVAVASKQWFQRHGMWVMHSERDIDYSVFPADSAQLFGPNTKKPSSPTELLWHQEFKCAPYTYEPYHGRGDDDDCYWPGWVGSEAAASCDVQPDLAHFGTAAPSEADRQKFYDKVFGGASQMHKVVVCPKFTCQTRMTVPDHSTKLPLHRLVCPKCKSSLAGGTEIWTSSKGGSRC